MLHTRVRNPAGKNISVALPGVDTSRSPTTIIAGARIAASIDVWSMSRTAAQQPAYPAGSVPSRTRRILATAGGFAARVSTVKKRCMTVSSTAAIPCCSTIFLRASMGLGSE